MGLTTGDSGGAPAPRPHFDILHFEPELDLTMRAVVAERFERAAGRNVPLYILDLSGVSYLDSTIISLIVAFRERMNERDASVRVLCSGRKDHLNRLFEITGLDRYFTIYATLEAALSP